MTHLVVLVDSERPDAYVNSVAYNLRSRAVKRVSFIHVYGFPDDVNSQVSSDLSSHIMMRVMGRLEMLATQGSYIDHNECIVPLGGPGDSLSIEEIKFFYSSGADNVNYSSEEVHYRDLRNFFRQIRKGKQEYIVDVTACRKRIIGDFVAMGLVDGLRGLYTFDVTVTIDYGSQWKSLLHELANQRPVGFSYIDILETSIIRDSVRVVSWRAPRFGLAWIVVAALVTAGIGINLGFGLDSLFAKWVNVVAQFVTFSALLLVFFPPRNR